MLHRCTTPALRNVRRPLASCPLPTLLPTILARTDSTRALATMAQPASKKQRTHPNYELLYHPGIPGRAEFVRLALEAAGVAYTDVANEKKNGYSTVEDMCINQDSQSADGSPPIFSPPALRVPGAGKDGKALVISQTGNILLYLGERIGMAPAGDDEAQYLINQVALTALDLNSEVHDTHHPVGTALYYEDQKDVALRKAEDVRTNRFPKFFGYFSRVLRHNMHAGGGQGKYLVGDGLTYADTTVWQLLDGCFFAFPREMEARREEFPELLDSFYQGVKGDKRLKEYLASERRLPYSMGVFRHYPELDRQ